MDTVPVDFWDGEEEESSTRSSTTTNITTDSDVVPPNFWNTNHVANPLVFKCPVHTCRHVYVRRADLKLHVSRKHSDVDPDVVVGPRRSGKAGKSYVCPFLDCPCGYSRRHDLTRHLYYKHSV